MPDTSHYMKEHAMHESMSMKTSEYAETVAASSPLEEALERMYDQETRVEKAFAVLTDRLSSVLQPEEPTETAPMDGPEKSSVPRSPVTNRLGRMSDDLASLARHIQRVTDLLDV